MISWDGITSRVSRRNFMRSAAYAAAATAAGCWGGAPRRAGPNIVLILADDLGYGDLGSYGSRTIRTPNLDRLAEEGIRFTDYQSACSVCSPSRASLLTGRYPSRCGMPFAVGGVYTDLGLEESEISIARLLKQAGYMTACIGKWHLGFPQGFDFKTHAGFTSDSQFHPVRHGFDLFHGMVGNTHPDGSTALLENNGIVDPDAHVTTITEHFTRRSLDFMGTDSGRPFFLYFPHTRSHAPWMPNPRFAGKSPGGVYGDMVEELDWSTGEILRWLDDSGKAADTLVIFTSDNGSAASRAYGSNGELRAGKGSTFEGGTRVPCLMRWPARLSPGATIDAMASAMDILPTIAAITGAALPRGRVIDGMDLGPELFGHAPAEAGPRILYYYNGLNLQAVREGRWKLHLPRTEEMLVWWDSGMHELASPLLYDLQEDPGETEDVAARYPDIVGRLLAEADRARAELGSWNSIGSDQHPIEHMMDDRRSLRHLRTQQNHQNLGRDAVSR